MLSDTIYAAQVNSHSIGMSYSASNGLVHAHGYLTLLFYTKGWVQLVSMA